MKILVRLPNWLGDMVMSLGFIRALRQLYPDAEISVIAKKGIDSLLEFFPPVDKTYIFSKKEYPGLAGAWRFGRNIRRQQKYDLFFSLPDSLSAAVMAFATRSRSRVGYGNEWRNGLLTHSFKKGGAVHRVDSYVKLLEQYSKRTSGGVHVCFDLKLSKRNSDIVVNIHSEASSRRLPLDKAASLLKLLREQSSSRILLIGGPGDREYTKALVGVLTDTSNIIDLSGKTTLRQLVELMASSQVVLTTDSGPAHLANATGTRTVVLFGAGNELATAPYNISNRQIIRFGQLPCEPCVKNTCVLYGVPKCLQSLDEKLIINSVLR